MLIARVLIFVLVLADCCASAAPVLDLRLDTSGVVGGQLKLSFFITKNPPDNFSQAKLNDSVFLSGIAGRGVALDPSRRSVLGSLSSGITIDTAYYDAQPLIDFSPGMIEFHAQLNNFDGSTDQFGVALIDPDGGVAHTELPYSAFLLTGLGDLNVFLQEPQLPSGGTAALFIAQEPEPGACLLLFTWLPWALVHRPHGRPQPHHFCLLMSSQQRRDVGTRSDPNI
jgi:hypothetical protein